MVCLDMPAPRDPWRDRTIQDLATSLPRQQGSWHHLFTSAHLPQFALASSVSGYSQKVADLLESMAEPLGRLQELDIGDINVVPLRNLRGIDWGQSNQGENRSWAQKLWCNMRMNVHGLATFGTKRSILRNKSAKIFPRPQGSVFFGG